MKDIEIKAHIELQEALKQLNHSENSCNAGLARAAHGGGGGCPES
jgi:hypothetical protein